MSVELMDRDIRLLHCSANLGLATRVQLSRLVPFPERKMRERLVSLHNEKYINRHNRKGNGFPPIYYPSERGLQELSERLHDDRWMSKGTKLPYRDFLEHHLAVTDTQILLRLDLSKQNDVQLVWFHNENAQVNPDELDKSKRLSTVISFDDGLMQKNSVVAKPDAVFGLEFQDLTCIYLLEEDRASDNATRVIRKKLPGYRELFKTRRHVTHFSETIPDALDTFRVLFVAPNGPRRDALRRALHRQLGADEPDFAKVFRFVAKENGLETQSFLSAPIFYGHVADSDPQPMIQRENIGATQPKEDVSCTD